MTPRFVRRLVAERRITFHRVGKFIRFDPADVDALILDGRVERAGAAEMVLVRLRRATANALAEQDGEQHGQDQECRDRRSPSRRRRDIAACEVCTVNVTEHVPEHGVRPARCCAHNSGLRTDEEDDHRAYGSQGGCNETAHHVRPVPAEAVVPGLRFLDGEPLLVVQSDFVGLLVR